MLDLRDGPRGLRDDPSAAGRLRDGTTPGWPDLLMVGRDCRPLWANLFYCWPSVGWCVCVIKEANGDRRFKMEGEVVNFFVHYEIDDNTSRHVLKLDGYGGDDVDSWVLLEALE